jgi:hypothetical protein
MNGTAVELYLDGGAPLGHSKIFHQDSRSVAP